MRSGEWLNRHCLQTNGPVDSDDFPDGHEVDCLPRRRWVRLEYKHRGETMRAGQVTHLRALAEMSGSGWDVLLLVVRDEGQSDAGAQVQFAWHSCRAPWRPPNEWALHRTTLEALGRALAAWVWCGGDRPAFACPPPPACAACGASLPRMPQQTMPIGGQPAWVCQECFAAYFARPTLSEQRAWVASVAPAAARGDGETSEEGVRMERLV